MNTGALVVAGVAGVAIYLVTRTTVEARWYRTAKHRLVDRYHYASFAAMAEAQLARIDAATNFVDREAVMAEWRNVMETDPYADLKRSGHDGYTRLADLDQGSADTLRAAYDAYEAYKVAASEWWADFDDASSTRENFKRVLRATASALDDARRVPVELPPKTSTSEDVAHAAGSGAAAVGNAFSSAASSLAEGAARIQASFAAGFFSGAGKQLLIIGALTVVGLIVLHKTGVLEGAAKAARAAA